MRLNTGYTKGPFTRWELRTVEERTALMVPGMVPSGLLHATLHGVATKLARAAARRRGERPPTVPAPRAPCVVWEVRGSVASAGDGCGVRACGASLPPTTNQRSATPTSSHACAATLVTALAAA